MAIASILRTPIKRKGGRPKAETDPNNRILRETIVDRLERGDKSAKEIATAFGISVRTLRRLKQRQYQS